MAGDVHALVRADMIGLASAADEPALDALLAEVPDALIYYTAAYRAFLRRVLPPSVEGRVLVARGADGIAGFLPFWTAASETGHAVLNSQPFFGSHGGPVVRRNHPDGDRIATALCEALAVAAADRRVAAFTAIESPFAPFTERQQQALGTTIVDHRIGQFTALPDVTDDMEAVLFARLHNKTRNAVRKGRKAGLEIACLHDEATLDWFHGVHERSIVALGGVPKPRRVFDSLFQVFEPKGAIRLYVGRRQGVRACALLVLLHGRTVEYYTPVVEDEHRESQALSALIVDVMLALASEGFRTWNWGGTWPSQAGVHRFKSRWGAEERSYRYHGRVIDPSIRTLGRDEILRRLPFFYVYPFA